jgi:hypothetical protein
MQWGLKTTEPAKHLGNNLKSKTITMKNTISSLKVKPDFLVTVTAAITFKQTVVTHVQHSNPLPSTKMKTFKDTNTGNIKVLCQF